MRTKSISRYIQVLGFLLFFGLCITMLSKEVLAYADSDVKLNVKSAFIIKDGTYEIKVYNMTDKQTILFRSGNTDVARVINQNGLIKGISNGTTVITAVVSEGDTVIATLQCDVFIGPAAISIKLTKSELTLAVGMKRTLRVIVLPINTVEKATFYSSDSSIATVSSAGRIRAKEPGQVQVYAILKNDQSALCTVTVLSDEDYQIYLKNKSPEELTSEEQESEEEDQDEEISITSVPEVNNSTDNIIPDATMAPSAAPTSIPQISPVAEITQEASISTTIRNSVPVTPVEIIVK